MPLTGEERKAWIREEDQRRWRKVFLILYSVAAFTFALGILSVYLLDQDANQNRIDRNRTVQLEQITRGLRQTIRDIQQSRIDINRDQCESQNVRRANFIRQLDELIAGLERAGATEQAERARANRAGTILLANALSPKQDCDALIRRRFRNQ